MGLKFREMKIGDLPEAFAVRLSTVENAVTMEDLEEDYSITTESLSRAMSSHVKGWLCEDSGRVVGFAMGDRSNGEVQVVAVLPDYEDRAIGKNLLERVKAWLLSEGHEEIWLLANPDPAVRAHGFYRRLGWRATGLRKGDDEVMVFRAT